MNIRHKRKEKEESVSTARELFQWVAAIVAAVLIALAIDNFVIVNAQIPSGSMENTIMTGDRVIGNRFAYSFSDPQRFDIIIFRYPDDESQLFIKRIIGLPGDYSSRLFVRQTAALRHRKWNQLMLMCSHPTSNEQLGFHNKPGE